MNGNNIDPQLEKLSNMMWVTPVRNFRYKGYWFTTNRKMLIVDTSGGLSTVSMQRPLRNDSGFVDKSVTFPCEGRKHCLLMPPEIIIEHCREVEINDD